MNPVLIPAGAQITQALCVLDNGQKVVRLSGVNAQGDAISLTIPVSFPEEDAE